MTSRTGSSSRRAVVLDGHVRPELVPAAPVHAELGLERTHLLRDVSAQPRTSGGGSAFMEMQLYPPGNPPFVDSASCDDTHWCAALTIDSLECTTGFATCNTNCEEPVNFGFIQKNGVPTGPPAPQDGGYRHLRRRTARRCS